MEENKQPRMVEDLFGGALKLYEDGSIIRTDDHHLIINIPPSEKAGPEDQGVASKDVVIDEELDIWVRLYLPSLSIQDDRSKLPILLYFHGGGFCFLSPAFVKSHNFCQTLAASLGAMVVSVNYRLAPEHRLPAAYHDAVAVLDWLRCQARKAATADPWLHAHADFSNVFLVGDSSGGNIVHHILMRSAFKSPDLLQTIRGSILLQPFFGGEERTQSEIACPVNAQVNVQACDSFWRLALPVGANRNHPFTNTVMYLQNELSGSRTLHMPPMVVVLGGKDCLRDRGMEYYQTMYGCGKCKQIDLLLFDEEEHGFHHADYHKVKTTAADDDMKNNESNRRLMRELVLFVSSNLHHSG